MDQNQQPSGGSPTGWSSTSTAGVPTTSPTGGHSSSGPSANAAMFAARQAASELALEYYAAALCGIIAIFMIGHWTRLLVNKRKVPGGLAKAMSPLAAVSRAFRRIFIRKLPGFSSAGHGVLYTVYVALNVGLSFFGLDTSRTTNFAARFGWMSAANFTLVVFLALKNTPLAILTSYSYERLNPLHQISGYATIVFMILHASLYSSYFIKQGNWDILHEDIVTAGIVLGFAMFASGVEAVVLRRFQYELFYVFHILLFIVMVVALALHRPELDAEKVGIIACSTAALWLSDRLIRFTRLIFNGVNNEATVYPLPNGGTQVLLKKPLPRAIPGKHCFVWLPKVRLFETHPFTIVSNSPTELIVNAYSGFTRDLAKYARENPGAVLKVSLEGPYGTFPDPIDFDKVLLVAGGSGASFTFGMASNMLEKMTGHSDQQIEFIWTVRHHDNLSWFSDHLDAIRTHTHGSRVALRLHATTSTPKALGVTEKPSTQSLQPTVRSTSSADLSPMTPVYETEKDEPLFQPSDVSNLVGPGNDLEKDDVRAIVYRMGRGTVATGPVEFPVEQGRPDVAALIREAVKSVPKDKRVLIAACGPDGLVKVVRNTAASLITKDGPAVELHCEQFGW
ncbi:putative Ferric reductase like transmembrane component [Seiridium cardinale]|uniref:Ferric reductase like transmembrane component n=1 Tax=Seiridium cardinale TaxID=138064 RepID=A0ABR2XL05_9PEZI